MMIAVCSSGCLGLSAGVSPSSISFNLSAYEHEKELMIINPNDFDIIVQLSSDEHIFPSDDTVTVRHGESKKVIYTLRESAKAQEAVSEVSVIISGQRKHALQIGMAVAVVIHSPEPEGEPEDKAPLSKLFNSQLFSRYDVFSTGSAESKFITQTTAMTIILIIIGSGILIYFSYRKDRISNLEKNLEK